MPAAASADVCGLPVQSSSVDLLVMANAVKTRASGSIQMVAARQLCLAPSGRALGGIARPCCIRPTGLMKRDGAAVLPERLQSDSLEVLR